MVWQGSSDMDGVQVETRLCPHCDAPVGDRARFCERCGAPVGSSGKRACAKCGAGLNPAARFCPECGAHAEVARRPDLAARWDRFRGYVSAVDWAPVRRIALPL